MPENQTSREEKVYNLVIELEQAKRNKKHVMKAHNEEIKRIQAEIKDILKDDSTTDQYH